MIMTDCITTTVSKVKKGDFLRLSNNDNAEVWIRGDFDSASREYSLISFNDSCREKFVKGSRKCFIEFYF